MSADTPYDRLRHFLPEGDEVGLDGYRVLQPIGEGGFGRVFKARQLAFDRDVAIKVLSATGLQEDTQRRFERECRAVGALSGHPHIVTIFDSGITPWGRPFIVMEHMNGGSVADRLSRSGPLGPQEALDVTIKICGALGVAHRNGILHRDIKPENLLMSAYGEPVLADFGVASIPGGYQTHTGAITASLAHAAPEVLDGAVATPATDVYSLASTLFTLLAARAPFDSPEHPGLQALIARTMTQPVPDLRAAGVPGAICDVIETGMAKDPSERFADAAALGSALQSGQEALGFPITEMLTPNTVIEIDEAPAPIAAERATVMRPREILGHVPPPPPRGRPFWKSPSAAAVVALVIALAAGSTLAMNVRRPSASAARRPAGIPAAPTPADSPQPNRRERIAKKEPRDERKKNRSERGARDAGTIPFAGGSSFQGGGATRGGGGGSAATASPSNDTYVSETGGAKTTQNGDGGSGGGKTGGETEQPPAPAPANILLYHLYNDDGSYYFTSSLSEYNDKRFEYEHSHREAAVWETGTQKMRRICFGDGRCGGWVYIEKPAGIQTRPLYVFTGPKGDYYTTNKAEIPADYAGARVYLFGYAQ